MPSLPARPGKIDLDQRTADAHLLSWGVATHIFSEAYFSSYHLCRKIDFAMAAC